MHIALETLSNTKCYNCQIVINNNSKQFVLILESNCVIEQILKQSNHTEVRYELSV